MLFLTRLVVCSIVVLVPSLFLPGCGSGTKAQPSSDTKEAARAQAIGPKEESAGPSNDISQEQLSRLFSMTWDANDSETIGYPGNSGVNAESMKEYAWLNCVQLKTSVYFKDAGLKWKTARAESFVELPVNSESFRQTIRVIDRDRFAFKDGDRWLVFRARD